MCQHSHFIGPFHTSLHSNEYYSTLSDALQIPGNWYEGLLCNSSRLQSHEHCYHQPLNSQLRKVWKFRPKLVQSDRDACLIHEGCDRNFQWFWSCVNKIGLLLDSIKWNKYSALVNLKELMEQRGSLPWWGVTLGLLMKPSPRFAFIPSRIPHQIFHSSEILRNLMQLSVDIYDASKDTFLCQWSLYGNCWWPFHGSQRDHG